jgi:hypothetical protein
MQTARQDIRAGPMGRTLEPISDLRVRGTGAVEVSLMNPLSQILRKVRRWINARNERGYDPY